MPTYEYECKTCSHNFEVFQAMSDEPVKVCPKCGKEVRRLIFGGTGVIFKGSGFYVTDKGKGSANAAARGKTDKKEKDVSGGGESSGSGEAASKPAEAGSGGAEKESKKSGKKESAQSA